MQKWKATIHNIENGGPKNLALRRLFNDNLRGGAKTSKKPQQKKAGKQLVKTFPCKDCGKRYRGKSGVFYHRKKEHKYIPKKRWTQEEVFKMPFYKDATLPATSFIKEEDNLVFEDGGDLGGDTNVTMQDLESHASDLDSFEIDLDFVADTAALNGGGKYMSQKLKKKRSTPLPLQMYKKTRPVKRNPLQQKALIFQLDPTEMEDVFGIRARVLQETMSLLEQNLDDTYAGINQILSNTIARKPIMPHQFVHSLPSEMDDTLYIKENSATASGSNGINLLECTLNGKRVAVKISFDATVTDAFYETLINMFVFHATKDIDEVSAPAIYKFGSIPREAIVAFATYNNIEKTFHLDANPVVIVQDFVPGKSLWQCSGSELNKCLPIFFRGVAQMQEKFAFSHRDMHPGNLILDRNGTVHIIDFGMACVKLPSTNDSIQSYHLTGESSKRCLNSSHDLCTLLLALASHDEFGYEHRILLQDISNRYKVKILQVMNKASRTEEEQAAVEVVVSRRNNLLPPINFNTHTQIIHWHYLYNFYLFSFDEYAPQHIWQSL